LRRVANEYWECQIFCRRVDEHRYAFRIGNLAGRFQIEGSFSAAGEKNEYIAVRELKA